MSRSRVVPTRLNALDIGAWRPPLVAAPLVPQVDQSRLDPQSLSKSGLERIVTEFGVCLSEKVDECLFTSTLHDPRHVLWRHGGRLSGTRHRRQIRMATRLHLATGHAHRRRHGQGEGSGRAQHHVVVNDQRRGSQRWYPNGRTLQQWVGAFLVLQGLLQIAFNFSDGELWPLVFYAFMVPLGVAVTVLSRVTRVEAAGPGLRIVRPPSRERLVPWQDIADIRRDPPNAWASKLTVVVQDGEVISLPLPVDRYHELVERWKLETV